MCKCKCIQTVSASNIAVDSGITTITLPSTFIPVAGTMYNISLSTVIPSGTDGTIITITNGSIAGNLLNSLGSNVRLGELTSTNVLKVLFLSDPNHYMLIYKSRRHVC